MLSAFLLAAAMPWLQWGGPQRNFEIPDPGIAASWPAQGPKVVWKRPLGEGYSAILYDGGVLYTMYGTPGKEVVVAADANSGKTRWEHSTPVSFHNDASERGNGPHATPAIAGDRIFTAGVTGRLQCLDKATGKLLWTQELWSQQGGSRLIYGYANSPLLYRDLVIVPVGGNGRALAAFRQSDGSLVWKKGDMTNAYSSPILINVDGVDQVAVLMAKHIAGFNPLNGDLQWYVSHPADYDINVATLLWLPGNLLVASSAYGGGTRVLHLTCQGNRTKVDQLWHDTRLSVHHGNVLRLGDYLYGSSGRGPAVLTAVELKTGKTVWQSREFPKVFLLHVGGNVVVLDEDGNLALASFSPSGVKTISRVSLLSNNAWTPPTLAGTRLYVRDRREMVAVELGK